MVVGAIRTFLETLSLKLYARWGYGGRESLLEHSGKPGDSGLDGPVRKTRNPVVNCLFAQRCVWSWCRSRARGEHVNDQSLVFDEHHRETSRHDHP